jgi:hypothetical protein
VKAGADDGVDDQVAFGDLAEMQLPLLRRRDFDDGETDTAQNLEVDPGVAPHVADAAEQEHRRRDAALGQRPRDHEAVAAVVAAAAQHADLAGDEILERRFHRRDRLPPGVLHQHDRWQADVVDRLAIGLAHLLRIQNSHVLASRCQLAVYSLPATGARIIGDAWSGIRQREDCPRRPGRGPGLRPWVRLR